MTDYNICEGMPSVEVLHLGKPVTIRREQDQAATIRADYAITARKCPPYCIQPMHLAPGIETLGELEVLDYLRRIHEGEQRIMVVDSRTPDWYAKGTIPGLKKTLVERFGVQEVAGEYVFCGAYTLVIFCNGPWCGQTPNFIRTLIDLDYPDSIIKWYRGGMQDWCSLGLTVV
jgi:rhodanese-related sulfurtransferase